MPFIGSVSLFDWDEINFAEAAREMILTGDYLNVKINFMPFWEKPPLFFWLQVLSMKIFGINEFGARFPNALCGILTLIALYHMGRKLFDHRMGVIWMITYTCSILPFFYFKSGIIDPWFNLFILLGIYFGASYLVLDERRSLSALLSGLCIGLAVLTKGPVALLLFGLTGLLYLFMIRFRMRMQLKHVILFLGGLTGAGGFWFFVLYLNGDAEVVSDFIVYQIRLFRTQDAGHGGFPFYHFVVLLFGVFPASAFAFSGFRGIDRENPFRKAWSQVCLILLAVVLVVFSIVKTKIVHYSSLAYFPLTWLAAHYIYQVITEKGVINRFSRVSAAIVGTVWLVAVLSIVLLMLSKDWILSSGLIKDAFTTANLQAEVSWSGWEVLVIFPFLMGWILFYVPGDPFRRMAGIFTGTLVFSFITMAVILPKAEGYTQRAAIEFYKDKSGEDCYIHTLGFKSYAHLFYGKKMPPVNPISYDQEWLLKGQVDKPVYVVYKITRKKRYQEEYPQLKILYEKNGFVFTKREKPDQ
jgi:4-amino-4-deoxy-L-arabinose transferase-like glycosyltransferase